MIQAESDTHPGDLDLNGWAQSGYAEDGTGYGGLGGILAFSQWTYSCKNHGSCGGGAQWETDYGDPIPEDSYYIYKSVFESSDGHIHMYANGAPLAETNYNPGGDWDSAWDYEYFGETAHRGSDVPGIESDKAQFDRLAYFNSSGSAVNVTLAGLSA